ncbi:MAG TPA: response regulator, partial [Polyangiaceae bacterium LLY-WYZ-15_(1-7)]|nr:response regulator [Polyangiaceae bacterium LLY-WYZ-15_(1-7)]
MVPTSAPPTPRRRILVAEDEAVVAMDLEDRLLRLGYDVLGPVSTGDEAVELALAHAPDLLLLDVHLGTGRDGVEVAASVLQRRTVPVVFLSAFVDEATLVRAGRVDPSAYLPKPFDDRVLTVTLEMAFSKHEARLEREARRRLQRDMETRLAAILDHTDDAILVANAAGRIVVFNQGAERAFDLAALEALGKPVSELLPAELFALPLPARRADVEARRANGGSFRADVSLSAAELDGEAHITAIVRDVTAQRELERQLLRAQKLEAVGRVTASVAHDFNNLLSAIRLSAYLARSGGPEALVELDAITATVDRAEHLVRQLLAYPARTRRRPQIVDPVAEVTARRPLLETLLSTRGRLELELSVGAGVFSIDPGDLEQILVNLLVNARDALSQDGGEVRVLVRRRELPEGAFTTVGGQPSPAGSWVLLEVHDDGEGIAPEHRDAIFEPFFSTKPRGKGSGLGLASVGEAVRRAEGWLALESQEGVGTRVRVAFPPVEGLDSARPPSRPAPAPGRRVGRLLVAEEDPGLRCALARLLRVVGHDVEEVDSEARAVARLSEERLDLA